MYGRQCYPFRILLWIVLGSSNWHTLTLYFYISGSGIQQIPTWFLVSSISHSMLKICTKVSQYPFKLHFFYLAIQFRCKPRMKLQKFGNKVTCPNNKHYDIERVNNKVCRARIILVIQSSKLLSFCTPTLSWCKHENWKYSCKCGNDESATALHRQYRIQ